MYLRNLKEKDAEKMLEWMHDTDVVNVLPTQFEKMTLDDCYNFIKVSNEEQKENIHMAICSDSDEYLGTVSLKRINYKDKNAEYAIAIRKSAMGKGVSAFATREIIKMAFEKLQLERVYLCVFSDNIRAKKFYDKMNFTYEGTFKKHMLSKDGMLHDLDWYGVLNVNE